MSGLHAAVKKGKAAEVLRELTAGADIQEEDKARFDSSWQNSCIARAPGTINAPRKQLHISSLLH